MTREVERTLGYLPGVDKVKSEAFDVRDEALAIVDVLWCKRVCADILRRNEVAPFVERQFVEYEMPRRMLAPGEKRAGSS